MIVCVLLGPLCWFSTQCTRIFFFQKKQKQHKLLIKIITIIQRIRKATLTEWKRCRMSKGDSKTQIAHMNIHERNVLCVFFRILPGFANAIQRLQALFRLLARSPSFYLSLVLALSFVDYRNWSICIENIREQVQLYAVHKGMRNRIVLPCFGSLSH